METTIIADLAMILMVAGITTLIFKKLNQPLVLGYIIAGFLTSPNFTYFPTIAGKEGVELWAEIGVIFLMFALGLEFSFYKLKKVGSTAFIATGVAVFGMIIIGYTAGNLLGWNHMNSLFLGGMLSMSSTAIIAKSFDEMCVKDKDYAGMVMGVLIIEDIAGIVMMVLLSTLAAATADVSPLQLGMDIGKLVFCLVLWFVLGMYIVPSFFKRHERLFNEETLVVVSIGLCLCMVEIAEHMGYSAALGAFIMGSLIAEAPSAEKIEHLIKPIKDLFGAVFFVSVGMLVNPSMLLQYALPVLFLIFVTVAGQVTCATLGMIAAGQPLRTAVKAGFCLCQIGEFSFILAALGSSLNVTSDYLYPIIVAVSVITTFTTPFCMTTADKAYDVLIKVLPQKVLDYIEHNSSQSSDNDDNEWVELLKDYAMRILIFGVLLLAISIAAENWLLPYLTKDLQLPYANYITAGATLFVMAPLLRCILQNTAGNATHFSSLWFKRKANHIPLFMLIVFKVGLATMVIYYVFHSLAGWHGMLALVAALAMAYFISTSNWLMGQYLRIESRFLVNLNEKHVLEHNGNTSDWFDEQLYIATYHIAKNSPLVGPTLIDLQFGEIYRCDIILINDGSHAKFMPGGKSTIPGDSTIMLIGKSSDFVIFNQAIEQRHLQAKPVMEPQTLRSYMLRDNLPDEQKLYTLSIPIDKHSPLLGKSIRTANIREHWNCMVIGLARGAITMPTPNVSLIFEKGDLLWILGKPSVLKELVMQDII